ncbi:MAG TPA: transglutaminase domain-containing protein [Anaerolineaceae bacterium]|nr:transglutaminase domain-containing protein [Anaerolineaceae bacterium]
MNAEKRWLDFPALFSLTAAMLVAASRLSATQWTEDLGVVVTLTVIGAILGALLGYSRFSPRVVILFALVYTAFFVPWQLGLAAGGDEILWLDRLGNLGGRINQTINLFLNNRPSSDPLLFVANMALLFWLVSLSAAYQLIRHARPWQSLIIGGITLVIVDLYSPAVPRANFYSAGFVLLSLLLLTQVYFMKSKARWHETGVAIESETEFSIGRGALTGAIVLILLAWNLPSVVLAFNPAPVGPSGLSEALSKLRQRIENATASLQGPLVLEQEYFGDQLGLGTGSALTDEIVFTVKSSLPAQPPGTTYYWRGRSYDYYDPESGWDSTIDTTQRLEANGETLAYPEFDGRIRARFSISTQKNLGILYTPSLPLMTSRSTTAITGVADDALVDVLALYAEPPVRGGETYEVLSWISAPTVTAMVSAGQEYPQWVTDTYLQLPANFPPRIRTLAEEITAGLETPYEKTAVITRWLRDEMTYEPIIEPAPAGADPIEYFLFESKTGFCNYYATAEVLMLRSIGIPARLAGGYAQGVYNPDIEAYEVRRKQSHSWPEVFFPGIGWIEFEPTVSQPDIERLPGDDGSGLGALIDRTPGDGTNRPLDRGDPRDDIEAAEEFGITGTSQRFGPGSTWILVGSGTATGLALIFALVYFRLRRNNSIEPLPVLLEGGMKRRGWSTPSWVKRWSRLSQLNPIERAFLAVDGAMTLIRKPLDPSATPTEAVEALERALPEAAPHARELLNEYERAAYSQHPADIDRARLASRHVLQSVGRYWIERLFNGRIDETGYGD